MISGLSHRLHRITSGVGLLVVLAACGDDLPIIDPPPSQPPPVRPIAGLTLEVVTTGVAFPVDIASPPGDPSRLFIVDKGGQVRVVRNGTLLATPFLDISNQVSTGGERGLLGIAFAPDYATSRRFVVHFTNTAGHTRVVSLRTSADPDWADPGSQQTILSVNQPFSNHNGGQVAFGPDGMLYIALGDGGSGGDPQNNAQNLGSLLGKLLRLELLPDGSARIPTDNPFVAQAGARGEIWSYGLRNPWRFSFDPLNGDLYIADVGQSALEEVNVATAASGGGRGLNFGWRIMEGTNCFNPSAGCDQTGLTLPFFTYGRGGGCSITGGYVYRGSAIPELRGHYFYGDFCNRSILTLTHPGATPLVPISWGAGLTNGGLTTFGVDGAGELYVGSDGGRVYRIVARR